MTGRRRGILPSHRSVARLGDAVARDGRHGLLHALRHGVEWRRRRLRHLFRKARSRGKRFLRPITAPAQARTREMWRALPPEHRQRIRAVANRATSASRRPLPTEPTAGSPVAEPKVTVIVTSSNRSELLPVALRSIQLQDFPSFECIVVDDASTDDAALAAQRFAEVDQRFTVLVLAEAVGPSAARNVGIRHARGEYVCFLDDDDFLLDSSVRSRVEMLDRAPDGVAASYCDWVNVDPGVGLEVFRSRRRRATKLADITYGDLVRGAPFIVSSPMVRREILLQAGGFDEALWRAEDTDLWYRLFRQGHRAAASGNVGVAYRRSPGSLLVGSPDDHLAATMSVVRRYDKRDEAISPVVGAPEPLSTYALETSLMPLVLRYIALVAAGDEERAVGLGRSHLSAVARRMIDSDAALAGKLANYVAARTSAFEVTDVRELTDRVRRVLEMLRPDPPSTAEVSEPRTLSVEFADRPLRRLRGRPAELDAADAAEVVHGAVVLIPEARYHVDELGPLAESLGAKDVPVCFMVSPKTVETAWRELSAYTETVVSFSPPSLAHASAVVALNDWGPIREGMEVAQAAGVPTFAKVEGVQDFNDDDTGRQRHAYRTATTILCQGESDVRALPDQRTVVVGSSRLEQLWLATVAPPSSDQVLVNLNFTFGVLSDERDQWLRSVADAVGACGLPALVSRHPAERGSAQGLDVADKPFRHEISRSGALVSRFSTVPFEAMARGVPFVYHNPHGERVPTFTEPLGAFRITTSADELAEALTEAMTWRGEYRELAEKFFRRQVDVDPARSSAERAADAIVAELS